MKYEENAVNSLLLGILNEDPHCDLSIISQTLKLPKTEIMKRLKYLCIHNKLCFTDNGFYLTEDGKYFAASQDMIPQFTENAVPEFDWENCRYVPNPESFL